MSLTTAALGWGEVSLRWGDYFFDIPYVSRIWIGIDFSNLNRMIKIHSKMGLHLEQDKKNFHKFYYKDDTGNTLFYVHIIGNAVHRIWYKGIANMIPPERVFKLGKNNMFISNVRVDGHMLAIKSEDEVWLKEIPDAQCNGAYIYDVDSARFGVVKKAMTKSDVEKSLQEYAGVGKTKSVYKKEIYSMNKSEAEDLINEYKELNSMVDALTSKRDKLIADINKRDALDKAERAVSEANREYDRAKDDYADTIANNRSEIKRLIRAGKIYQKNNLIVLDKDSNETGNKIEEVSVPVYKTEYEEYVPEIELYEDYEQYERRRDMERTVIERTVYAGERIERRVKKIVDEEYMDAEKLVSELEPIMQTYEAAMDKLKQAKAAYDEVSSQISKYMETSEYKENLRELDSIKSKLSGLLERRNELKNRIYA